MENFAKKQQKDLQKETQKVKNYQNENFDQYDNLTQNKKEQVQNNQNKADFENEGEMLLE